MMIMLLPHITEYQMATFLAVDFRRRDGDARHGAQALYQQQQRRRIAHADALAISRDDDHAA